MKQNIIRKTCQVVPVLLITGALAACDAHIEESEETKYPVHVLCVDGTVIPYSEYEQSKEQAIAVVFHIGSDGETEGNGYAVYLWDMTPKAFADSLGVEQGTSADITAYDGNENTFALYETEETASPMAEAVFALWKYGQSAYVPSVAQMRLLYAARGIINPVIEKCGGDPLPTEADECWYWTSTEVEGQQTVKAWLYSTASGAMQETPKTQAHKVCGTWHYQSGHREMRRRPASDRSRRVLVLDIDGGGRTADGQSMALLDSQRSHAGNAQDAGA